MEIETMKPLIKELKEKNVEILDRIVQHIDEQDAKTVEKDQKIAELKHTLTDVQKSLTNSVDINSHLIALHKAETTKFQAQISRRDKLISDLKKDVKNVKEEKAEMIHIKNPDAEKQKVIDQHAKKILELEAESKGKTLKIYGLINENYKIVTEKYNKITELQQKIETCKNETEMALQEKQKIIDLQNEIIAKNEDKITVLEKQNQKQTQRIIRLQKTVHENEGIIVGQSKTIKKEKIEKTRAQNFHQKEKNKLNNKIAALRTKVPNQKSKRAVAKNRYFEDDDDFNLFEERTYKKNYRRIPEYCNDDDFFV